MRGDDIFRTLPKKISSLFNSISLGCLIQLLQASCQNLLIIEQSQNKWERVSSQSAQKEQRGESVNPIRKRKLLMPRILCKTEIENIESLNYVTL